MDAGRDLSARDGHATSSTASSSYPLPGSQVKTGWSGPWWPTLSRFFLLRCPTSVGLVMLRLPNENGPYNADLADEAGAGGPRIPPSGDLSARIVTTAPAASLLAAVLGLAVAQSDFTPALSQGTPNQLIFGP